MAFDLSGARQAGYSDQEIVVELAKRASFDLEGARRAGYDDATILERLASDAVPQRVNVPPEDGAVAGAVAPQNSEPTLGDKIVGAGETALSTLTGLTTGAAGYVGGFIGGVAGQVARGEFGTTDGMERAQQSANEAAGRLTYQPTTRSGQQQTQAVGGALAALTPLTPQLAQVGAGATALRASGPVIQSIAAKAAAIPPAVVNAVRAAVTKAPEPAFGGSTVGSAASAVGSVRGMTAEMLPVPVRLTLGAEKRDAVQLAFEKEQMKSADFGAPLRSRAEENNLQALQNFDVLIDRTGAIAPDMAATGNKVVSVLSEGLQKAKNKTRVAYFKADNSPESQAQVLPSTVVSIGEGPTAVTNSLIGYLNDTPTGLSTTALIDHAKQYAVRLGVAAKSEDGALVALPTTVKAMEALRREINSVTGFEPAQIRQSAILKNIIDAQTGPVSGPLYAKAREARTAQARKYENRAIVARLVTNKRGMDDPKVAADQVFRSAILNASPEEITFLSRVLRTNGSKGREALAELQGATIRHLRDEATKGVGMDSNGNALVSPAKLNDAINQLEKNGRLDVILGKQQATIVRDLNDVVRYVNTVPPGTLINSSGTAGALLAAIGEAGITGATTGLPVPVVSILRALRENVQNNRVKAQITRALNIKPVLVRSRGANDSAASPNQNTGTP